MSTHLSDKGQLQGDIEDDLGVAGCQLLSSAWGRAAPSQSPRVGQPLCDICFQHAMCVGAKCQGFCLASLGRVPSWEVMAESHRQPKAGAVGYSMAGSG